MWLRKISVAFALFVGTFAAVADPMIVPPSVDGRMQVVCPAANEAENAGKCHVYGSKPITPYEWAGRGGWKTVHRVLLVVVTGSDPFLAYYVIEVSK
jgi:hypothetical protein